MKAIADAKAKGSAGVKKDQAHFKTQGENFSKQLDLAIKSNPELEKELTSQDATGKKEDKKAEDKKDVAKADKKAETKAAAKPAAKAAAKSEGKELPKTGEETAMVVIGAGLVATIAGGALVVSNRKKA